MADDEQKQILPLPRKKPDLPMKPQITEPQQQPEPEEVSEPVQLKAKKRREKIIWGHASICSRLAYDRRLVVGHHLGNADQRQVEGFPRE